MVFHRRIVAPLIAGLLIISFLSLSAPAEAQAVTPVAPVTVQIGAYIVNLGDFNVGQGSFSADFYLWFSWQGNWTGIAGGSTPFPAGFELMNGVINKITLIESDQNISGTGQNYLIYRVQAAMTDPVNLQDYPFDTHSLTIELEDQDHNVSTLIYQPDSGSRLDPLVQLQGWDIQWSHVNAVVVDHFYNTTFGYPGERSGETYSRFVVTVPIERPVLASTIQAFIPIILILIVAFVAFFIKMEHFGTRVSLNVLTLLTAAAFQITLTSGIPQFGFLTLADRLMISVYGLLVYALIVTVGLATFSDEGRLRALRRLNEVSWIAFPLACAVLIIVQFVI